MSGRPRLWTAERTAWLRSFVPGHSWREIAEEHERIWGWPLTPRQIANGKARFGLRSGTVGGRFEKGRVPANKGRRLEEFMSPEGIERSKRGRFAEGHRPHNAYHELLDERTDASGAWVYVRPRDRRFPANDWISKGRFEWMRANGREWPEGHVCAFADRDPGNFDPENLVPVPAELWPVVQGATGGAPPYRDRETLEAAIAHARLVRARAALERAPRPCGVCGLAFEPRFARQMTCDACLAAGRRAARRRSRADASGDQRTEGGTDD